MEDSSNSNNSTPRNRASSTPHRLLTATTPSSRSQTSSPSSVESTSPIPDEEETSKQSDNISVIARIRPTLPGEQSCIEYETDDSKLVYLKVPNRKHAYMFEFEKVLTELATQRDVFEEVTPVIDAVMKGFNGTICAYGQTGSGKTYTMHGPHFDDPRLLTDTLQEHNRGLVTRVIDNLFQRITNEESENKSVKYVVRCSFLEIYMEQLRDLLVDPIPLNKQHEIEKPKLEIRSSAERGIFVTNATETVVTSRKEVIALLEKGGLNRVTAHTEQNEESSRSHAVFLVSIWKRQVGKSTASQLYLVDLAGSERANKTQTQGIRLSEARKINQSLFALGKVITALSSGKKSFVPYRDSLLTRLLQNSFGGNSRSYLIVTCSPSLDDANETLSTLRFGDKTKSIKNRPIMNEDQSVDELKAIISQKDSQISEQQKQISELELLVKRFRDSGAVPVNTSKQEEQTIIDLTTPERDANNNINNNIFSTPIKPLPIVAVTPPTSKTNLNTGHTISTSITSVFVKRMNPAHVNSTLEIEFSHFICPLSGEIMTEPYLASDGFTYQKEFILDWLKRNEKSALSNVKFPSQNVIPNLHLKRLIRQNYKQLLNLSRNRFALLPRDILLEIIGFLDVSSIGRFSRVCTYLNVLCNQNSVWTRKLNERYPNRNKSASNSAIDDPNKHPKDIFKSKWLSEPKSDPIVLSSIPNSSSGISLFKS